MTLLKAAIKAKMALMPSYSLHWPGWKSFLLEEQTRLLFRLFTSIVACLMSERVKRLINLRREPSWHEIRVEGSANVTLQGFHSNGCSQATFCTRMTMHLKRSSSYAAALFSRNWVLFFSCNFFSVPYSTYCLQFLFKASLLFLPVDVRLHIAKRMCKHMNKQATNKHTTPTRIIMRLCFFSPVHTFFVVTFLPAAKSHLIPPAFNGGQQRLWNSRGFSCCLAENGHFATAT